MLRSVQRTVRCGDLVGDECSRPRARWLGRYPGGPRSPWNLPGPDLDCKDIGHRVIITGPDYHHLDADHDGIGCESWG